MWALRLCIIYSDRVSSVCLRFGVRACVRANVRAYLFTCNFVCSCNCITHSQYSLSSYVQIHLELINLNKKVQFTRDLLGVIVIVTVFVYCVCMVCFLGGCPFKTILSFLEFLCNFFSSSLKFYTLYIYIIYFHRLYIHIYVSMFDKTLRLQRFCVLFIIITIISFFIAFMYTFLLRTRFTMFFFIPFFKYIDLLLLCLFLIV